MNFYDIFGLIGAIIIASALCYASNRGIEKFKEI